MTKVADDRDERLGKFFRQMHDVAERVIKGSLDPNRIYRVIQPLLAEKKKTGTVRRGGGDPAKYPEVTNTLIYYWIEFWKVVGGRDLTDAELILPAYQPGFDWPIVAPPQVGNQAIFELIKRFSPTYSYWADLDRLKVEEEYLKAVDSSPIVLVKPSVETDLKLSYNDAVTLGIPFISLRQYLALVAFLGWLFKNQLKTVQKFKLPKHLDVAGWTCVASLAPGGLIALGNWSEALGKFRVHWSPRGLADLLGGFRQAVC